GRPRAFLRRRDRLDACAAPPVPDSLPAWAQQPWTQQKVGAEVDLLQARMVADLLRRVRVDCLDLSQGLGVRPLGIPECDDLLLRGRVLSFFGGRGPLQSAGERHSPAPSRYGACATVDEDNGSHPGV